MRERSQRQGPDTPGGKINVTAKREVSCGKCCRKEAAAGTSEINGITPSLGFKPVLTAGHQNTVPATKKLFAVSKACQAVSDRSASSKIAGTSVERSRSGFMLVLDITARLGRQ